MTRKECLKIIARLDIPTREAIAQFVETAETQGDWVWNGEDSVYEDDVNMTLCAIGKEIRRGA